MAGFEHLDMVLLLGLTMVLGVYLGRWLFPYVSRELFIRLVLGMLVLFGGQFLFW
ncbi:MAG: hypothetical protein AB7N91_10935 [Candidatus Tectimicrobiota bacterium]